MARVWPRAEYVLLPVADGGEGTAAALADATGGHLVPANVAGALPGDRVAACWACLGPPNEDTAVVEMAEAIGLARVAPERRDVKAATSRGVGELIRAALNKPGIRKLIVGLGGTATNDGGAGLLRALGVRVLDDAGREISDASAGAPALASAAALDVSGLRLDPARLNDVLLASDVDNPLCGPRGASAVFGPQKGASPNDVAVLDAALTRWGEVLGRTPSPGRTQMVGVADVPGAGAAGGALAALLWLFPHARVRPGIDVVLDAAQFEMHLAGADLVLTGEGRLDTQTLGGKAVLGVAKRAQAAGVPCAALVGALDPAVDANELAARGLCAVLPIAPGPGTLKDALASAETRLADAAERAARWLDLGRSLAAI